jgi:WD40 repeat protein
MFLLKGHRGPVQSVAFSADGRTLLSVGGYAAWLWSLEARARVWFTQAGGVYQARFAPGDAAVLTTSQFGRPELWDARSGRPFELPAGLAGRRGLKGFTFSPQGGLLAASDFAADYALHWWRWPDGEPLPQWDVNRPYCELEALAFRPDGVLVAGMNRDGVRLFDVASAREIDRIPFPIVQVEYRLAFAPDGRRLAVASGARLSVIDLETKEEVASLRQPRKFFLALAFTPDGRHLATVSNEETVKFWGVRTWKVEAEFAWQVGGLRCVAFSPDGMLAAAGGTGRKVVVWDVDL